MERQGFSNLIVRTHSELDLIDQAKTSEFFQKVHPDYVILAAARVGGIQSNSQYPAEFIYENIQIQSNVIHQAWKNGCKKLVFLGSSCVYPRLSQQPIKEKYLLTGPLEPTNEGYAVAKLAGIKMCEFYRKQHGFNAMSIMPCNLYGPGDNFNPESSHVIPSMISKIFEAKKFDLPTTTFFGDGSPLREFLYVDDFAKACLFILEKNDNENIINVGSKDEFTIKELAELISEKIGYSGEIQWDLSKPNGMPRKKLDTSLASKLGWNSMTKFTDGIERTLDWYKEAIDV